MTTVSLVEDDADYRELVRRSLHSDRRLRIVSSYATAEEALNRLPFEKPSVALVAIKLPILDGIECVRRLRAIRPALPTQFVMLTGRDEDEFVFSALKAGARGYLLKNHTTMKKLIVATQEVAAGGSPLTPLIARKVVMNYELPQRPAVLLSLQEQKVLLLLSQGFMYKQIAAELGISLNTVRKHLRSIYAKLGVHSRTDAAMHFGHDQHWTQSRSSQKK